MIYRFYFVLLEQEEIDCLTILTLGEDGDDISLELTVTSR